MGTKREMPLPTYPKWDRRPKSVTLRLSDRGKDLFKKFAENHNSRQADVIEWLIKETRTGIKFLRPEERRPNVATLRLSKSAIHKLNDLKAKFDASQADIVEWLLREEARNR
jgi:hypothetical protein